MTNARPRRPSLPPCPGQAGRVSRPRVSTALSLRGHSSLAEGSQKWSATGDWRVVSARSRALATASRASSSIPPGQPTTATPRQGRRSPALRRLMTMTRRFSERPGVTMRAFEQRDRLGSGTTATRLDSAGPHGEPPDAHRVTPAYLQREIPPRRDGELMAVGAGITPPSQPRETCGGTVAISRRSRRGHPPTPDLLPPMPGCSQCEVAKGASRPRHLRGSIWHVPSSPLERSSLVEAATAHCNARLL